MPCALCVGVKIIFDQILQNSVWLGKKIINEMKISVQLRLTKKVISECFYSMGSIFWQHLVSSQPTVKLGSVQLQIKVFFMQGVCRVYKVLKDDESFFGGKSRSLKTISVLIPNLWGIKFCWFEALSR